MEPTLYSATSFKSQECFRSKLDIILINFYLGTITKLNSEERKTNPHCKNTSARFKTTKTLKGRVYGKQVQRLPPQTEKEQLTFTRIFMFSISIIEERMVHTETYDQKVLRNLVH